MAADIHRYKIGDIEVTVLSDGFRMVPLDGYIMNASTDEIAAALRDAGLPTDRMKNTYSPIVLTTGGKRVLFDTGNGEAALAQSNGERGTLNSQSRRGRHRPQHHRRRGDLAFPCRPRERPADAPTTAGVPERRDQGARGRVEVLDGRRRDEPGVQGPHDRAVRQQSPRVRRARPQGHALRLGQGGRARRHRGRHARPQHRPHLVRRRLRRQDACSCSPTSATMSRSVRAAIPAGTASSTRTRRRPRRRGGGSTTCWSPRSCRCRPITFPFPALGRVEKAGDGYRVIPVTSL